MKLKFLLVTVASSFLIAAPAFADTLSIKLSSPTVSVAPGGTYDFVGTLMAPLTNTAAIYLNGDSFSVGDGVTLDDTAFFSLPFFLNPGQSFTGSLFNIALSESASGTYLGSYSLLGGGDATTYDTLGSSAFQVTPNVAIAPTPEPGSWLLLSTGLAGIAVLRRRFSTR